MTDTVRSEFEFAPKYHSAVGHIIRAMKFLEDEDLAQSKGWRMLEFALLDLARAQLDGDLTQAAVDHIADITEDENLSDGFRAFREMSIEESEKFLKSIEGKVNELYS